MIKEPKKTVSVVMPLELHTQLKTLAQENGYTLPGCIRQILRLYLRRLEEFSENPDDWWGVSK